MKVMILKKDQADCEKGLYNYFIYSFKTYKKAIFF
jgi:hypothetical protein